MSFATKIGALMARPGQDVVPKDDVPWWLKYGGRTMGSVGGFTAMFLGVFNCIGLLTGNVSCFLSGIWQLLAGFVTVCIEGPCCCLFVEYVQNLSDFVDKRPYWNRAVGYMAIALPAVIIYANFSSIFGSSLIFVTGIIYGMMSLGRKASRQDMAAMASPQMATSPAGIGGPIDQRSTLMEDPDVWRSS